MRYFDWSTDKNEWLKEQRDITFEEIVFHILHGGLLDVLEHPNKEQSPGQRIFVVNVEGYVCLVPYVETEENVFLKTIIPSRKMTKKYLKGDKNETE
ncbi:MAG TPA: hypothetical protein VMX36_06240 [Sedimentisphaerales bacterium]|nr:hypothetical protein [Sedimentisphaerales bacterium]